MCIDFKMINQATIKNKYPLPRLDDLFVQLKLAIVFSKIEIKLGYRQLVFKKWGIPKTIYKITYGYYECLGTPFLSNAPGIFMNLMDSILQPYLGSYIVVFINDILVYSNIEDDHRQHLSIIL